SATVRPREEIARFLAGSAPVSIIAPESAKRFDLAVSVPVEDMTELGSAPVREGATASAAPQASIWPHVEEQIVDRILECRSTIVFANSRRLAERLTARLNEIYEERLGGEAGDGGFDTLVERATQPASVPAQMMGASGQTAGSQGLLAMAHHGSE